MKSIFLIVLLISVSGCASLKTEMHKKIQAGDDSTQVVAIMGKPDTDKVQEDPAANTKTWNYTRRGETCSIVMKDEIVESISCIDDEEYVSPWRTPLSVLGTLLKGMGEGLSNTGSRTISCTSYNYGSTIETTCR